MKRITEAEFLRRAGVHPGAAETIEGDPRWHIAKWKVLTGALGLGLLCAWGGWKAGDAIVRREFAPQAVAERARREAAAELQARRAMYEIALGRLECARRESEAAPAAALNSYRELLEVLPAGEFVPPPPVPDR